MLDAIREYYQAVCECYRLDNIETLYNQPIIRLITAFGCQAKDKSGARSGKVGENIDVLLWREGDDVAETDPFAGIEVKKIGGFDDRAKKQIKDEAALFGNAILTNNLVWQFWRAGEDKMTAGVQLIEMKNGKLVLREDNAELFVSLIEDFLLRSPAQIRSANKLAEYMAIHAKTIRSVILGILKEDEDGQPLLDDRQRNLPLFNEVYALYSKIKTDLRPALTSRGFADMYAQTIVYGLFIARYNDTSPENFNRYEAVGNLRQESDLLKLFFSHITTASKSQHPTLEAVIDKLCDLYRICDITQLLNREESKDTIVHFYEEFLTYYDPALRKSLGVFYTPWQVVRYLVSMVDKVLVEDFDIPQGLSDNSSIDYTVKTTPQPITSNKGKKAIVGYTDEKTLQVPRVAILDPACGTGTFHAEIIKFVKEKYFSGGMETFYPDYIQKEDGLLSRLIAFEIMMTSYVVAHLKIRRTVDETLGGVARRDKPASIFLTNTLSPAHSSVEQLEQGFFLDFSSAISEEARKADNWKTRRPIKVIIGNPPYLAASTNPYDISAYKFETDGKTKLQEKNPKWLGDDYVKFFRFAQEIIERTGEGILAYVSNNGYMDNPTFRGMRASLLRTFDQIYIVNLHGSANKKETAPDGSKDENIFEIMQGVSLFIGVKTTTNFDWATVYYSELWGLREAKFSALDENAICFNELSLDPQMAYFIPLESNEGYASGVSITELFPINVVGIVTARDALCIQNTKNDIDIVLRNFQTKTTEDLRSQYNLGVDTRDWSVEGAVQDVESQSGKVTQIAYRPFDHRWTYFTGRSKGFHCMPRGEVMKNFIAPSASPVGRNIGLVFCKTSREFFTPFVSENIITHRLFSAMC